MSHILTNVVLFFCLFVVFFFGGDDPSLIIYNTQLSPLCISYLAFIKEGNIVTCFTMYSFYFKSSHTHCISTSETEAALVHYFVPNKHYPPVAS